MKLVSVNVGVERPLPNAKEAGVSGIFKMPVQEPVTVTHNGLAGDVISDQQNHGGPDQAVYVYGVPDYDWWANALGHSLSPGTFGENLTVSGLESATFRIGDRLTVGSVVLEVTAPRIPCATLERRMEMAGFVKRFIDANRPGLYCRVLAEGNISQGDNVTLQPCQDQTVTVMELWDDWFEPDMSEAGIRRFLAAPIAIRARLHKEQQLQTVLARQRTSPSE